MPPTIVMIHGMFCTGAVWRNYVSYFESRRYTCLKPTLRFHDMSPGDEPDPRLGTTSLLDYVEDLEQVVGALYEPPVIMGHAMGGLLAQMLAARGLGGALVLLNPAPPAGLRTLFSGGMGTAFRSWRRRWAFWRRPVRPKQKELARTFFSLVPPARQHELSEGLVCESGRAAFEMGFWLLDKKRAARVDPAKITCPTLIIGAGQDRVIPPAVTRRVAGLYRHAAHREFADHGHWVLGEPGWEDVAGHIREWLEASG